MKCDLRDWPDLGLSISLYPMIADSVGILFAAYY